MNKLNKVKSFIVMDGEVDGKSEDEVICILRNKIADIEGRLELNIIDIGFFRCPERFADIVVYKLGESNA